MDKAMSRGWAQSLESLQNSSDQGAWWYHCSARPDITETALNQRMFYTWRCLNYYFSSPYMTNLTVKYLEHVTRRPIDSVLEQ